MRRKPEESEIFGQLTSLIIETIELYRLSACLSPGLICRIVENELLGSSIPFGEAAAMPLLNQTWLIKEAERPRFLVLSRSLVPLAGEIGYISSSVGIEK